MYTVFFTHYATAHLIDYSAVQTLTFICTGEPKYSCGSLNCGDLEPNLQYIRGMPVRFSSKCRLCEPIAFVNINEKA
jgi:hypothetical protein